MMKILLSVLMAVMIPFGGVMVALNSLLHQTSDKNDNCFAISKYDESQTGIYDDAERVTNMTSDVGVYFVSISGTYVGLTELLALLDVLTINPQKQIYLFMMPKANPNDMSQNWFIDWSLLTKKYDNVHFNIMSVLDFPQPKDFDKVIKASGGKQMDVHFVDWSVSSVTVSDSNLRDFVRTLHDYFKYFNTLTFATDGWAHITINEQTQNDIKAMSPKRIADAKILISRLAKGDSTLKWDSVSKQDSMDASVVLPTLLSLRNPDMVNSHDPRRQEFAWSPTNQMYYENAKLADLWNSQGAGMKVAYDKMSKENQILFQSMYHVLNNHYVNPNAYRNKTNIVYSGGEIGSLGQAKQAIQNIMKYYLKYHVVDGKTNILLKNHPRSNTAAQEFLVETIKNMTGNHSNWIQIVDQRIPSEVLPLTGVFKDDATTHFKYSVIGTSTSIMTYYDIGINDDVFEYLYTSAEQRDGVMGIFTQKSSVVDFRKAIINDVKVAPTGEYRKRMIVDVIIPVLVFFLVMGLVLLFFTKVKSE